MSRRQKHKGKKRPKEWHRGKAEAWNYGQLDLPDTGAEVDVSLSEPEPVAKVAGGTNS